MDQIHRVYKKFDNVIVESFPPNVRDDFEKVKSAKINKDFDGLEYILIKMSEFPEMDGIEKLYFDGGVKKENLKTDHNYEFKLMTHFKIKFDHIDKLEKDIDSELDKNNPDMTLVLKNKIKIEKLKSGEIGKLEIYKIALDNLDKRVADGKPDKPIVRKKLQDKIKELEG